jgi:hypothetical protein
MAFRSFKQNQPCSLSALILVGAFSTLSGCNSDQFTATTTGPSHAGASGASEAAGAAGEAGEAAGGTSNGGSGGTASGGASAGTAGSAGAVAVGCDCGVGTYCQDGTKTCRACSDFSELSFAAPEKLAALSQSTNGNERFPRAAGTGTDLFYRAGSDAASILWYAPTPVSGIGHALLSSMPGDSAPVYAPKFSPPQNFFFDRLSANVNVNVRQIMVGTWLDGALTSVAAAPAPINSGSGDFSVAIAADVHRAYWMSTRNNPTVPDLLWATFGSKPTDPAVLALTVQASKGKCPRLGNDATPWVNAAGTLLLFRSESVDDNCNVNDSGAYDMFAAPLAQDGTSSAPAVALSTLNNTGGSRSESDPSLSVDSCTIYFASDDGNGNFSLYRAGRN